MTVSSTAVASRAGNWATCRRRVAPSILLLAILIVLVTAASELSPLFYMLLALSLGAAAVSARYPWFSAVLPLLVFNIVGTDLAAGIKLAGVEINAIDIIIFPSLMLLLWRILTGSRKISRPGLAIIMLMAWILLETLCGLVYRNPLPLLRNELHVFLFLPLAYFLAVTEITTKRSLLLLLFAVLASTAMAGAKALIITFFVAHTNSGISYAWQAWTDISSSFGGQRTRLDGADTMFVMAVPLLAAAAMFAPRCKTTFFLLAGSPFVVFGLLASLTRTYWMAALATVVLALLLGAVKAGKRAAFLAGTVAAAMIAAQILSVVFITRGLDEMDFGQIIFMRVQTNDDVAVSQNLGYRQKESEAFLDASQRHITWGSGLGATVELTDLFDYSPITTRDGHNILLEILLKSGLIGLVLFLGAIGLTTWRALKGFLDSNDPLLKTALLGTGLALPFLIVTSVTINRLSHFEGAFFIGMAVAIVEIARRLERQSPPPQLVEPRLAVTR